MISTWPTTRDEILDLTPEEFEHFVADLWSALFPNRTLSGFSVWTPRFVPDIGPTFVIKPPPLSTYET